MKIRSFIALLLVLVVSLTAVGPAYAVTDQQDKCEDAGGTWTGADAFNGECEYPVGNSSAEKICGEHGLLTESFDAGVKTGEHCDYEPTPIGAAGSETGSSGQAVTLHLGQGKNGSVAFAPGACPKKCTISANLLRAAKNALPSGVLATLSVRIVGGSGGSYLICFNTAGISNPTIYKFIGGSWVRFASISSGNKVCASTTGSASFYLGAG